MDITLEVNRTLARCYPGGLWSLHLVLPEKNQIYLQGKVQIIVTISTAVLTAAIAFITCEVYN